jgi:hypothetical protein
MSKCSITTLFTTALAYLQKKLRRGARRGGSPQSSVIAFRVPNFEPEKQIIKKPHSPVISQSVLNDDVLLHILYIHRLHIEDEVDGYETWYPCWDSQRWWYQLAHVSRQWRRVILSAPRLLDLHLVCTSGMPVADVLAHWPPLPLIVIYWLDNHPIMKAEDEKGALLTLSHRDRVRRVALRMPSSELEKLLVAMDGQFPNLERLNIVSSNPPGVTLPRTFGAPNLSHVKLVRVALPIHLPLLTTTALVSLQLQEIQISAYFHPSYLLRALSLIPQLETLWIAFNDIPLPSQLRDTESASHVTLHNLRKFEFQGSRAYLEGLCARMTAPVLSIFHVQFFNLLTFSAPHLLSFMQTSVTFRFHAIKLTCSRNLIYLQGDPQPSSLGSFSINLPCHHLVWHISSAIQILDVLFPVLSVAEQATLIVSSDSRHSGPNNYVDRTQWRRLLRPLGNVKLLRVVTDVGGYGLNYYLSTVDGEQPLDLLPNLEEVQVSHSGSYDENAFMSFIHEREAVGRPVRVGEYHR